VCGGGEARGESLDDKKEERSACLISAHPQAFSKLALYEVVYFNNFI
jgi:hypothetical protein